MRFLTTAALVGAATAIENYTAIPAQLPQDAIPLGASAPSKAGFTNGAVFPARGGRAVCVSGTIPVQATSTMNVKLNYELPQNQTGLTQALINFVTPGSPFTQQIMGGMQTVSDTYNIFGTLCLPSGNAQPKTVQIATHGIGFNRLYWDVRPGYSYVDVATGAGYGVFIYDRLGTGLSSHPDALSVVQSPLELAIAQALIEKLRAGALSGLKFEKVVAVGHSFGSLISQGLTATAPQLVDAAILTGFSTNMTGLAPFTLGLNLAIASQSAPYKFSGLSNGYVIGDSPIALQTGFLHAQGFAPELAAQAFAESDTATLGELFTQSAISKPAMNYTGPVAVVNGAEDLPFCFGNCSYPADKGAEALKMLYPKASRTESYLAKEAGHGINYHYSALEAYDWIQTFLKGSGINP